jgi:NADPH-dependent curcumin reductase CurA
MAHLTSREIRLKNRPTGVPTLDDFELATVEVAPPGPGEAQVKNLYMSVDPYMRGRMIDRKSYVAPFQLGQPLEGGAVGEVVASNDARLRPGDLVMSFLGWRESFNAPADRLQKLELRGLPPQAFLGVAGMPGLTAYAGLIRVAGLKEGDVVFVSAAAGAVGQVVCQLAKLRGHTVIGSAGGAEKEAYLKELGVDRVIDYKRVSGASGLTDALRAAAPDGIDVYFDNVGGDHLEAALSALRPFGRIALCGMISQYNASGEVKGPSNLGMAIGKNLRLQGFIVSFHQDLMPAFLEEVAGAIGAGKLKWRESVDQGIEQAPSAFIKLFTGENLGKMLVKLG